MRATRKVLAFVTGLGATVAATGCDTLTVPDLNNPGLEELTENPTRTEIVTAAQGLLVGARAGIGEFNRYVSVLGVLGRESYNFDGSDPRLITELLVGPLDPGGASFGGSGHWDARYRNIRAANVLLTALEPAADFFTAGELEGIRGFAKTIQAHDFLLVINTRDEFGAPIDVDRDPTEPPAPIATKDEVFGHILALLDEGAGHLQAAGASFPFQLTSGFTASGFDTPAGVLQVNRALKARVQVYREDWSGALASLAESFLNDDTGQGLAGLEVGAYHSYGTGAGDRSNGLFGRRDVLPAHPSFDEEVQPGDERLERKTELLGAPIGDPGDAFGLSSQRLFRVYGSLSAPIPIIRNEELLLLRAEANLQGGDPAAARDDINLVRQVSGGLPEIDAGTWDGMSGAERLDELLYNRRFSLWFEGHRWIDMRRYERLGELPIDNPSFVRFSAFPIPSGECVVRSPAPEGCSSVPGF
jgi:starch-binding outer membrane protein, SusD/RagB family